MKHSEGFLKLVHDAKSRVREVTVAQVRDWLAQGRKFDLVDVREDHEWAKEHARGARHVGRGILERDVENLIPDRGAEVVLYCGGGYRSALSADSLQKMGYRNVHSMAGGFRAWTEAGLPVDKG
jgi:rhodanese-related sulfurtransferase